MSRTTGSINFPWRVIYVGHFSPFSLLTLSFLSFPQLVQMNTLALFFLSLKHFIGIHICCWFYSVEIVIITTTTPVSVQEKHHGWLLIWVTLLMKWQFDSCCQGQLYVCYPSWQSCDTHSRNTYYKHPPFLLHAAAQWRRTGNTMQKYC